MATAGAGRDENRSTFDRTVAVIGLVWIPLVLLFTYGSGVPVVWKWAATGYSAYGFSECLAALSDRPEWWRPKLAVARVASISGLVVAFVYMVVTTGD